MPINVIKKPLRRLLTALLFLGILGLHVTTLAASLTATTDRTTVSINESLRLVVESDQSGGQSIDFSQLEQQFDILNQQSSSRQQIINGRVSSSRQWVFILAPQTTGTLLIPSFELNGSFSEAIEIKVSKAKASDLNTDSPEVLLKVITDKNSLYVQEQVLVTFQLFYRIPLNSYEAPGFSLKDTTVEKVADKNYTTLQNGKRYNVLEITYTLHPQASGKLLIPAQRWRLEKPARNFFNNSAPYLFVQSQSLELEVKPVAGTSTASHWLPSTAITLSPKWESEPGQANAGEPISFSLVLSGNGLSASQLPEIELPPVEGLKYFSEKPETNTIKSSAGIIGTRTSRFTIIPEIPGKFTLPGVSLKWWNTETDKEVIASVVAQEVWASTGQLGQQQLPELPDFSPVDSTEDQSSGVLRWQLLIALILLLMAMLVVFLLSLLRKAFDRTHPKTDLDSERQAYKNLLKIIDKKDPRQIRQHLLVWARLHCQQASISSLQQVSNFLPELRQSLTMLDECLYREKNKHSFDTQTLLTSLRSLKTKKQTEKPSSLSRLYPTF